MVRKRSERLEASRIEHQLLTECLERSAFLALFAESRVVVCLPRAQEGFHLPALEAMASGALVVTLDCIGNRGPWPARRQLPGRGAHLRVPLLNAVRSVLALPASAPNERAFMRSSGESIASGAWNEQEQDRVRGVPQRRDARTLAVAPIATSTGTGKAPARDNR